MRHLLSTHRVISAIAVWSALFGGTASAQGPTPVPTAVEVFPPDVNLFTDRGRQAFVVKATYADGLTRDVTAQAKAALANPALAKLDKNVLTPAADGATELKVE